MTQEVLAHGDDEAGGGPGRAVGVVVAVVLLAIAGVAVARSRAPERAARPSPSPAAPSSPPPPNVVVDEFPDPFDEHITVPRPPPGVLRTVLLPDDLPGFLVPGDELPVAVGAEGGPAHARVLVGWCAATKTFQDAAGEHFYDEHGRSLTTPEGLPTFEVRRNARDPQRIDVAGERGYAYNEIRTPAPKPRRCPAPLYYPKLPPRAGRVHDTVAGFRVLRGQYVVTTESRAFCERGAAAGCAARGWEEYALGALPRGDLAGSYTWEGEFVVRGDSDNGELRVLRLPGARLVRRERVGAAARIGIAHAVQRRNGVVTLHFNPFEHRSGTPGDDSPPGPIESAPDWEHVMVDVAGGLRSYVIRPDAEIHLGDGFTGLGEPRGNHETLQAFLADPAHADDALWLVLDDRGRVLRIVVDGY